MPINFWFLWFGFVVSTLGTYSSLIIINLYIYDYTRSAVLVGIFLLVRLIPAFIIGSIAGATSDRFDRRKLMIISDLSRAILILLVIFVKTKIYPLYIIIFLISIADRFYQASFGGGLPNIVGMDKVVKANSYLASGRTIALVGGPILGGLMISTGRYALAFLFDALTYLFSAFMIYNISVSLHETTFKKTSWWKDIKEGYGFIFTQFFLGAAVIARSLDAFGSSSLNVGLPVISKIFTEFKAGLNYGFLISAFALGEMIGSLYIARMKLITKKHPSEIIMASITIMALGFGFGLNMTSIFLSMILLFIGGLAEGVTVVHYNTILQKSPDEIRGRVFGISETCIWSSMAVGMFLSGVFIEISSVGLVALIFSMIIAMGCTFLYLYRLNQKMLSNSCKI